MTKRIVPITFSWHVPTESADYICAILNSFINGLQDSGVDIYERAKFSRGHGRYSSQTQE